MKFEWYKPARPFTITQAWGVLNPAYAQFGFSHHNGIDFALQADGKLRAPCRGIVVRTGNQPLGGGIFLGLMTEEFDRPIGTRVLIDFLHCAILLKKEGDIVKIGDVIAIADSTGFSTGPHTHMQTRRVVDWNGGVGDALQWIGVDKNDANNSFDPMPYMAQHYADEYQGILAGLANTLRIISEWLSKYGAKT